MSETFGWCKDKTRLAIWDKQVFCVSRYGSNYWYLNGEFHRENGPAIKYANGDRFWYLDGELHRENGPVVEFVDGDKWWCLNGRQYSKSDYWKEVKK